MSSMGGDLIARVTGKLRRNSDGLEPAVREAEDRNMRYVQRRGLIALATINAIGNVGLIAAVIVLSYSATHVKPAYFAVDHGRIMPLVSLSQPYRLPQEVLTFAQATLQESFSLDFNNYRAELEGVRQRYTMSGFKSLLDGLATSGILDLVKNKRLDLTTSISTGVVTEMDPDRDGIYTWVVKFPLTLKLVGQTTELPEQHLLATVRVSRVSTLDSVEGIGVTQVITSPN